MEMIVNIPFNQLLVLVKRLSPLQKRKLQEELSASEPETSNSNFKKMLLNGPVFTGEQIKAIEDAHQSTNEWRKK
jgi:hypothetical protein